MKELINNFYENLPFALYGAFAVASIVVIVIYILISYVDYNKSKKER